MVKILLVGVGGVGEAIAVMAKPCAWLKLCVLAGACVRARRGTARREVVGWGVGGVVVGVDRVVWCGGLHVARAGERRGRASSHHTLLHYALSSTARPLIPLLRAAPPPSHRPHIRRCTCGGEWGLPLYSCWEPRAGTTSLHHALATWARGASCLACGVCLAPHPPPRALHTLATEGTATQRGAPAPVTHSAPTDPT